MLAYSSVKIYRDSVGLAVLTVRAEQMKTLSEARVQDFYRRVRERLSSLTPAAGGMDADDLVRTAGQRAGAFHLTSEWAVARFIELLWLHSGTMPEFPCPALSFLTMRAGTEEDKLNRLEQWFNDAGQGDA